MTLRIIQVEEIKGLLRQVPALVDQLERRDSGFYEDLLAWLRRVEAVLEANRLASVSDVAALRSTLVQAGRGQLLPELHVEGRPTRKKIREVAGSHVIHQGNGLLQDLLRAPLANLEEADRICRQLAAVARAKGYVEASLQEQGHAAALAELIRCMAADPDLAAAYVHLTGLVGTQDAAILLDRAVPELG